MKLIKAQDASVFAFEIDGTITEESLKMITRDIHRICDTHEKVRTLARIKSFDGADFSTFFDKDLFAAKWKAMNKVDRYALVGGPAWMQKLVEVINPIFPKMEMRTFALSDEASAWKWLESKPYSH